MKKTNVIGEVRIVGGYQGGDLQCQFFHLKGLLLMKENRGRW